MMWSNRYWAAKALQNAECFHLCSGRGAISTSANGKQPVVVRAPRQAAFHLCNGVRTQPLCMTGRTAKRYSLGASTESPGRGRIDRRHLAPNRPQGLGPDPGAAGQFQHPLAGPHLLKQVEAKRRSEWDCCAIFVRAAPCTIWETTLPGHCPSSARSRTHRIIRCM
jgi:hypothetical protein